jgi:bacillaene synthase trans-acting acyltransferase
MSETVFMFSGQGSQYFQMGRPLFEEHRPFRRWMLTLDDQARALFGQSVIATLYDDARAKGDRFDRTLLTHPAIFMVEYALAQSLIESGVEPDLVLGVSLGAFAAAAIAGFIGVEDALTAVIRQATALETWGEPGAMTAVLADPALFEQGVLGSDSELAAINLSSHFVIAARRAALDDIEATLRARQVSYQRLPVSFPFHSRWIDAAKVPFESSVRSLRYANGRLPMVCCDRACTLSHLDDDYFWRVVRHPIRFREATRHLEAERPRRYIDVGPAGTLATFLKYGLPATSRSTVHAILTPFGSDQKNLSQLLR